MTKILVLSGRKQSGKSSAASFITGTILKNEGFINGFTIENGNLQAYTRFGKFDEFENTYPYVKTYGFADGIKEIAVNYLGLRPEQVYGTDDQKNSITEYLWQNMPGLPQTQYAGRIGRMTGRDVMKYVGTEIFRSMNEKIWNDLTLNKISIDKPKLALINDGRHQTEIIDIKNVGGKIIRLLRNPFPEDNHASETALDKENFDQDVFDAIIDNRNLPMEKTHQSVHKLCKKWGLI